MKTLTAALVLFLPSLAASAPITTGVWSPVGGEQTYWDGTSWDCSTCGIRYQLSLHTGLSGLEWLHDGSGGFAAFTFNDAAITATKIFQNTAWMNGTFGRNAEGAFTYDSGTGRLSNSFANPGQYALFRRVGAETTQYFLGIEDILLSEQRNDRDYNDYGVSFTLPTQSIPEPGTLLLTSLGAALIFTRRRTNTRSGLG